IRLRRNNGLKFAVKGSKQGLFIPSNQAASNSRLLICEGPTDTAAMLDMGFSNVVGRPSCTGGATLLAGLGRSRQPADIVIVADADEPGLHGADCLGSALVMYCRTLRVICPPGGMKDVRDWHRSGATRKDVESAILAAPVQQLTIQARKVCRGR